MAIATEAIARRKAVRPSDPIDRDTVRRLSALPEDYILAYVWQMAAQTPDRLGLLLELTHVVVARPPEWDSARVRHEHEHGHGWTRLDRRRCFACDDDQPPLYFHHILEVQHGGSNAVRNQVPLCFACHQYLHPWLMDEPAPRRVQGFESLASMMGRVVRS